MAVRSPAEWVAATAYLMVILLAFVGLHPLSPLSAINTGSGEGDSLRQVLFLAAFALAAGAWLATRGAGVVRGVPGSLLILLLFCLCSTIWSVDPSISLRRASLLGLSTLTVFGCVDVLGDVKAVRILRVALTVILAADWISVLVSPNAVETVHGPNPLNAGSFRGLHPQKNDAGAIVGIATLVLMFTSPAKHKLLTWVYIAMGLAFLVLTRSKASLGCFLIGALSGLAYLRVRPGSDLRPMWIMTMVALVLGVVFFMSMEFEQVSRLLGDRYLLTGRGDVWSVVVAVIRQKPLLGFGFGAVWDIGPLGPVVRLTRDWVAEVYTAHNGYLDVTAMLGLIGLGLSIVVLLVIPQIKLLAPAAGSRNIRALLVAWFAFILVNNVVESDLLITGAPLWGCHVLLLAFLHNRSRWQWKVR